VLGWACVSIFGPAIVKDEISTLNRGNISALWLVAAGLVLSLGTLGVVRWRARAQSGPDLPPARERALGPGLAFDEPTS
jgi:hypothetical protein